MAEAATAPAVTESDRRMNGQAIAARAASVQKLIEAHSDEFGELLKAERVSRGLSESSGGESTKAILARLEKAEEKAKKAREILAQRGVTVTT